MEIRYTYTDEDLTWGESTLALWQSPAAPGQKPDRWTWSEDLQLGRALLRLAIAGEEIFAAGQVAAGIKAGLLNPEQALAALDLQKMLAEGQTIGGHQAEADQLGPGVGDLYRLANASVLDVYRGARAVDGYVLKAEPPQLMGWQIPLIVVGGAALVVSSWLIAKEVAPAWQAVESERTWSAAKAYAEIQTNKALIAAGQKPIMSDWAKLRSSVAEVQGNKWFHLAAGAGVGAIGVVGGYYGLTKIGEKRSRPSRAPRRGNPSRRTPARRRPKRRRNQQMALQFDYPEKQAMRKSTRKTSTAPRKRKQTSKPKPRAQKVTKKAIRDALETVNRITVPWHWRTVERRYSTVYNKPQPPMALTNDPQDWEEITASDDLEHAILVMEDQAFAGYPAAVVDNNAPTYEHRKSIRRVAVPAKRNPKKNPGDPHKLHKLGTEDANRAVDDAITRQLKRWPTKPPPKVVDKVAKQIGHWPSKDEWSMYQLAWTEQVQTRKMEHAQKSEAPTVRANPLRRGYSQRTISANIAAERKAGRSQAQASAIAYKVARQSYRKKHPKGPFPAHLKPKRSNPKRDKSGRFVSRKRTSPKGKTRGSRRGKKQRAAGRSGPTK